LTAYLESVEARLRQAELERAAAEARAAAERAGRRRTRALAAALVGMIAVAAGGGLLVQYQAAERRADQARREAGQRQQVEAAIDKAAGLRQQGHWREAEALLEQARLALGEAGPGDLRRRVEQEAADLALVDRLEAIRLNRSTFIEDHFNNGAADEDYAAAFHDAGLGAEGDDPAAVAARVRDSAVSLQLLAALDDWAVATDDRQRRTWLLEIARRADTDEWRNRLRDLFRNPAALRQQRAGVEALAQELLADDEQFTRQKPPLLVALGNVLNALQADGVPLLTAAQAHHPDDFWLNLILATALIDAKRWDEAVGYFRVAVALRPSAGMAHNGLGGALKAKGLLQEAVREYRTAIALDPKLAPPHNNLGNVLIGKGQLDEAIREYRTAIRLAPKLAKVHSNLGSALTGKKDPEGAIAEYRIAIALDPRDAQTHYNLGVRLRAKRQLDEAAREFRTAVHLDPKYARAHNNLGHSLWDKGDLDGAIAEFRLAIDCDPKLAEPRGSLGQALLEQGRFAEALEATRGALSLVQPGDQLHQTATRQLQQCEQSLALDQKLPGILAGTEVPANDTERLALARLCQQPFKKRYAASARLYAAAFAQDAKLVADQRQQPSYNAVCAAAQAGCGQGDDARALPDKEAFGLRRQALGWLRADVAAYAKMAKGDEPAVSQLVRERMQHWQEDADLASVRDRGALDRLPDGERQQWRLLWDDVAALLRKVEVKK
jgi:serine/threonine-protein kinase